MRYNKKVRRHIRQTEVSITMAHIKKNTKRTKKEHLFYITRIIIGIGRGSYFGFSVLELFFGIYFGKLTGLIGSAITGAFALFWTGSFVGLNAHTEKNEQRLEKMQLAIKEKWLDELELIEKYDTNTYQKILDNIQKKKDSKKSHPSNFSEKMVASGKAIWKLTKNIFVYTREFFNASKDITKAILGTCLLFGIVLPVVFAKGSMLLFLVFSTVVFGFSFAVALEHYIRKKRDINIERLKQENKILASHVRYYKTYRKAKAYGPNKSSTLKDRSYKPTAAEKNSNISKYIATILFGAMNGLYFAFTISNLYWGIIMMPLSTSFALYIPIILLVVSGIGHTLRHSNREHNQQKQETKTKSRYYHHKLLWQKKVAIFKKENPNIPIPSEKTGKNLNLEKKRKIRSLIETISGINFFSTQSSIEAGRAMKNSTKLVLGFINFFVIPIGSSALGFLGTFGLLPTVGLLTFALIFAALSIRIFLWQNERNGLRRQLEQKTDYLKRDIAFMNRYKGPASNASISVNLTANTLKARLARQRITRNQFNRSSSQHKLLYTLFKPKPDLSKRVSKTDNETGKNIRSSLPLRVT